VIIYFPKGLLLSIDNGDFDLPAPSGGGKMSGGDQIESMTDIAACHES
jgi:hypothetical protein